MKPAYRINLGYYLSIDNVAGLFDQLMVKMEGQTLQVPNTLLGFLPHVLSMPRDNRLEWLCEQGFDHHYEVKEETIGGKLTRSYFLVLNDQSQAALFKLFFSVQYEREQNTDVEVQEVQQ